MPNARSKPHDKASQTPGTDSQPSGEAYAAHRRAVAWAFGETGYLWRSGSHHLRIVLLASALLAIIAIGA